MAKRGPKTATGKQAVRLNAVRHGFLSKAPVIPGLESEDEWEVFRQGFHAYFEPEGAPEVALVDQMASLQWRLKRIPHGEAAMIAARQDRVATHFATAANYRGAPASLAEAELAVEEARLACKTLERLPHLNGDAALTPDEAAAAILAGGGDTPRLLEAAAAVLPAGVEPLDFLGWTAGLLREALAAMAARVGADPAAFLHRAVELAAERRAEAARRPPEIAAELKTLRRERVLPPLEAMRMIARYETALARQYHQAIDQLAAMQSRRAGNPVPINRIQVYGLP